VTRRPGDPHTARPRLAGADEPTVVLTPVPPPGGPPNQSLGRASSMMAVASLISRVTGFLRHVALASVLGFAVLNDSYIVANTLPNIVYELLLGGVLSSVMIPLLVRAQGEDADGGVAYTRRLLTVAGTVLLVATAAAMLAAPLLTRVYLGGQNAGGSAGAANPELATALALLLLPQIFFYGVGALLGAILNSRGVFGPFAWAPVLNNLVVLGVVAVFYAMPGEVSLDPVRLGEPKLLVLGLGTTLGIVVQALVLVPALPRVGFRYRPSWGWDRRLSAAGSLALWVIGYVLIGQVGYAVTIRVAAGASAGSVSIYAYTWLLLQVPYGVLGVSLLTALMPRMSRAAAEQRTADVVADLSLGSRLATVTLLPVSVLLTLFGPVVGVAVFALGRAGDGGGNVRLGIALAVSAFGLLPFAIMMLQLRVFYALTDSRTPTLVQLFVVGIKIPMLLYCGALLPPEQVVFGLAAANSASFVFGAVLGNVLLRRRLGPLRTGEVLGTIWRALVSSAAGGLAALLAVELLPATVEWPAGAMAWAELGVATAVFVPVTLLALWAARARELQPLRRVLGRLAVRHKPRRRTPP
jgi:putative peptidoglycan lipid II flippase